MVTTYCFTHLKSFTEICYRDFFPKMFQKVVKKTPSLNPALYKGRSIFPQIPQITKCLHYFQLRVFVVYKQTDRAIIDGRFLTVYVNIVLYT